MTQRSAHSRLLAGPMRAPRNHGELLAIPPLTTAVELAEQNRSQFEKADVQIGNRSLREFRQWTRDVLLAKAREWTHSTLGSVPDTPAAGSDSPLLFMTGHQPQLSHPGVWAKNIAVHALADAHCGIGLNLIVDNDIADQLTIPVPAGPHAEPHRKPVEFAPATSRQPWEELRLRDSEQVREFPDRVHSLMADWNIEPLLGTVWNAAIGSMSQTASLVAALTACRVKEERRWGMRNLELPVSELSTTEPFLAFFAHICRNAAEFVRIYNEAVAAYRKENRIRNHRQPVPDLKVRGDQYELPFWYWEPGETDRRRVFVRSCGAGVDLIAGDKHLACLRPQDDVRVLADVQKRGRLRTKALTTTLFARLALADLFVHGIGGAKYDEITDALFRDFVRIPAPEYLTITATLHLPLQPFPVTERTVLELKERLRDIEYNAERFLQGDEVERLSQQKQALIDEANAERAEGLSRSERRQRRPARRQRHLQLKEIEARLAAMAETERQKAAAELEVAERQLAANRVLKSREFPSVLFPEPMLKDLLDAIRQSAAASVESTSD